MSVQYCHECDKHIDTDYDAEHFDAHKITIKQIERFMRWRGKNGTRSSTPYT